MKPIVALILVCAFCVALGLSCVAEGAQITPKQSPVQAPEMATAKGTDTAAQKGPAAMDAAQKGPAATTALQKGPDTKGLDVLSLERNEFELELGSRRRFFRRRRADREDTRALLRLNWRRWPRGR